MASWATPGVKCVCVHRYRYENAAQRLYAPKLPVLGQMYTVRQALVASDGSGLCLYFEEVRNPRFLGNPEVGFSVRRFRPLVTRTLEEDLALFAPETERA